MLSKAIDITKASGLNLASPISPPSVLAIAASMPSEEMIGGRLRITP